MICYNCFEHHRFEVVFLGVSRVVLIASRMRNVGVWFLTLVGVLDKIRKKRVEECFDLDMKALKLKEIYVKVKKIEVGWCPR